MKKKKSVTKLDKKDLKDSNKYLLTQQELDSDGGIATKLVKVSVSQYFVGVCFEEPINALLTA